MKKIETTVEALKEILENIHRSDRLDSHPWAQSLFVRDVVTNNPNLQNENPGEQILKAIAELFRQMTPVSPPRHGLRLDSRWTEFGFLAARYFAPILFGRPIPVTFQDAWRRIDQSILLFVYGDAEGTDLPHAMVTLYGLVGNEPEVTPLSTISDWHRKGLQRLADIITARENYLAVKITGNQDNSKGLLPPSNKPDKAQIEHSGSNEPAPKTRKKAISRLLILLLCILVLGILFTGGAKVMRIYRSGMLVLEDITRLRESVEYPPGLDEIETAGPLMLVLRDDLDAFRYEIDPVLWITPGLSWVPDYGCDLASARELLDVADSMTDSAAESYLAAGPILQAIGSAENSLTPSTLTGLLVQAQSQFSDARDMLGLARIAREKIDVGCLSPSVHDMLVEKVDPLFVLMEDGLTVAVEFPRIVGASSEGPKTYLLLVQNRDELRPTGGFITAAGTLLLQDGRVSSLNFENSGFLDNWSRPYPVAPWQLRQYMNSPVLIFRDANWFPNFPTSALYAEYLYSYVNNHSVDGVIAFDQQLLVDILRVLGPIKLDGVSYPIDANNVIVYMRAAKSPTEEDLATPGWSDKEFINKITFALITKMFTGSIEWDRFASVLISDLNEHHILLQVDNPSLTSLLARRSWDGAVRPGDGDYLLVVDTNIGFNKTNAVVTSSLTYDVDLTNLKAPVSNLSVLHQNGSDSKVPCVQWNGITLEGQEDYPIDRCYWDYLRVYLVSGASLIQANPQLIPADWMIKRQSVPAQVDLLDDEIDGVQGFGLLKVVPGGQSLTTDFRFALPADVIYTSPGSGQMAYRLRIQKQPGTLAVPVIVRIHLPNNTTLQSAPAGAIVQGNNILIQTDLREDREFEIGFRVP